MDNKEIIDEISRLNNKIDECLKGLEILASGYKLLTEIAKDVCQISEDNFKSTNLLVLFLLPIISSK